MDLNPTIEQQQLVDLVADLFGDHVSADVVTAATSGHDADVWRRIVEVGALDMALAEDDDALSLLDLALLAEQHGRFLTPAPLLEVWVAARLLASVGALGDTVDVDALASGSRIVTLALRPAQDGSAALVPGGSVADDALVLVGDRLVLTPLADRATPVDNLGFLPLADVVVVDDATVVAEGPAAVEAYAVAVDEWRSLTASALVGAAAKALELAVDYVKVRKAFGRPVGQFQSVAHALADRATEVHGAELLAREAAWAAAEQPTRFPSLAAMALAFAGETAVATTRDALHFHGGYGFMLEYPVQLYFRRVRAWSLLLESPVESYRRVADQHLSGAAGAY